MNKFQRYLHQLWHVLHPGQKCTNVKVYNDNVIARQMLYDGFAEPEMIAAQLELPPISPDVAEMEHRAHVERLNALIPIMPLLLHQAGILAAAATVVQMQAAEDPTEEQTAAVAHTFAQVAKASVVSSIASAVDMGVLSVNKFAAVGEMEDDSVG